MRKSIRWVLIPAAILLVYFAGRYIYFRPAFDAGEAVVDIQGKLPDGQSFRLDELRGSYVLLDFWGSWCGPCLQAFPELQALYHTYHQGSFHEADGFEIVSIAIERDASRWRRTLARFRPIWPYHLLDKTQSLRFFSGEIARSFGVKQLPTKLLINPEGVLIASDWSLAEIERFLADRLVR